MTRITSFAGSGFDLGALHCAMLAAFSDYVVPMQPDAITFKAALRSRGFDPSALDNLLAAAATVGSLTLVNVDYADSALFSILQELEAHRFIVQSEMCLSLPNGS